MMVTSAAKFSPLCLFTLCVPSEVLLLALSFLPRYLLNNEKVD